jgi:HEAT repeat protein
MAFRLITTVGVVAVLLFAARASAQFEAPPVPDMTIEQAIAAIQGNDPDQQIDGARLLKAKGAEAKQAVPVILGLLREQGLERRRELLQVLDAIGQPAEEAVPELIKGLSHDNFHVRYLSCRVLGNVGQAARPAVQPLIDKLTDSNPSVRRNAAQALGKLGPQVAPDAVKPLVQAMKDRLVPVREEAVLALGHFGELAQFAIPDLKKMMDDPEGKLRTQAARSMWKLTGDAELVKPALVDAFRNNNVAGEATLFLAELEAVDELVSLLNSPADDLLFPLDALGRLGPKAKKALPALRQLANHPEQSVRDDVQYTIALIEGKDIEGKDQH